jgi:hypothetical protein
MAHVSQEMKAKLAPRIRSICKKYGVKASLAVRNHSTLVLNIKQGKIDFIGNFNKVCGEKLEYATRGFQPASKHISVNPYHFERHFSGRAKSFLAEVLEAMRGPDFFDHSDPQTDYFHTSHYYDVNIGRWDQPYVLESK